ncbi:MAG: phage tail assembly chaperone [Alphaproteobacteria bacterium]
MTKHIRTLSEPTAIPANVHSYTKSYRIDGKLQFNTHGEQLVIDVEMNAGEISQAETDAMASAALRTEHALAYLRDRRNQLLIETDYTQGVDAPVGTDVEACKIYRQALRDLPANTPAPSNPTWPTPQE